MGSSANQRSRELGGLVLVCDAFGLNARPAGPRASVNTASGWLARELDNKRDSKSVCGAKMVHPESGCSDFHLGNLF